MHTSDCKTTNNEYRTSIDMCRDISTIRHLMKSVLNDSHDEMPLVIPDSLPQNANDTIALQLLLDFAKPDFSKWKEYESYMVIASFIDAAVCIYIFKSDFPNQAPRTENLPLPEIEKYIQSSEFKERIKHAAEKYATDLSRILAPLFHTNNEECEKNGFETWGEPKEIWLERKRQLTEVFKMCLQLKADSVLTGNAYELVHYDSGTPFDEETMHPQTEAGSEVMLEPRGCTVEQCMHVGIVARSRRENDSDSTAIVNYNNFNCSHAMGYSEKPVPVAYAIVILEENFGKKREV